MNTASSEGLPLLVFIGTATTDTIALVEKYPEPDSRTVAEDLVTAGGGPAATAAVAAARTGARTAFIGTVGTDSDGERIVADLEAEGIDVSAVTRSTSHPSGASIVVVARTGSTRSIITRPGPSLDLTGNAAAHALMSKAAWIHADHMGWPALAGRKDIEGSCRLSVDGGNPIPGFTPDGVDLYVPTIEQLAKTFREKHSSDPDVLLRSARNAGARTVVATGGRHGSWGLGPGGAMVHVPAFASSIRSTLGAGDVFHGVLLASLAAGHSLPEAMQDASEAAAKSCEALEGRSGIPRSTHPPVFQPGPASGQPGGSRAG
ncbi:carbohydrate kinase family protein [Arthrobacter bambusae]|uniref:carbohydrate kinase family protein n=1 Tax=Arthrobacter bambusae TaxID=1338426 RepID=UPI002785D908|nr:PfkB family carbohydrate kinase [Arthrobacter bambusae]MDQ0213491.1 sulfofructose kinase [Arthrobacter bambusae]MDQ0237798.1 sulfofructose kinase [Arthrobacter bambusae]